MYVHIHLISFIEFMMIQNKKGGLKTLATVLENKPVQELFTV